jgi:hypothetical protein
MISLAPIFVLFIYVEWMLFTKRESFSGLIGILGVFLVPIMGGIFPMLMLAASRRKGDYTPKLAFGFLGNPLVLALVYLVYLGSVFVYGIFIWEDPIQRLMAIGVGVTMLVVTYLVIRQGAFARRAVIELKVEKSDTEERGTLALVDAGKPLAATFTLVYADEERRMSGAEIEIPKYKRLRNICIEFLPVSSREMKVWVHRVTPEGNSHAVPAAVRITDGDQEKAVQLDSNSGQVILPLTSQVNRLEIDLL